MRINHIIRMNGVYSVHGEGFSPEMPKIFLYTVSWRDPLSADGPSSSFINEATVCYLPYDLIAWSDRRIDFRVKAAMKDGYYKIRIVSGDNVSEPHDMTYGFAPIKTPQLYTLPVAGSLLDEIRKIGMYADYSSLEAVQS